MTTNFTDSEPIRWDPNSSQSRYKICRYELECDKVRDGRGIVDLDVEVSVRAPLPSIFDVCPFLTRYLISHGRTYRTALTTYSSFPTGAILQKLFPVWKYTP